VNRRARCEELHTTNPSSLLSRVDRVRLRSGEIALTRQHLRPAEPRSRSFSTDVGQRGVGIKLIGRANRQKVICTRHPRRWSFSATRQVRMKSDFYYRFPHETRVTSSHHGKDFSQACGDGRRTIGELIEHDPRRASSPDVFSDSRRVARKCWQRAKN